MTVESRGSNKAGFVVAGEEGKAKGGGGSRCPDKFVGYRAKKLGEAS